jgi:UDP-N-acetylglucosamine 2-epimerase
MLQSAVDVVAQWRPDVIMYAGDREEVWIGALLGNYLEIPTIHFYGGDHTDSWHMDNPVRHATSKLSSFHVVPTGEARQRLLTLGESDSRIRVLGSLALDNFRTDEPWRRFRAMTCRSSRPTWATTHSWCSIPIPRNMRSPVTSVATFC